jgi:HEAT repeat protein
MLKDQDAHVRQAVADTLAELKESCWGSLLLPMVTDSSTEVQTAALRALRALRVPESFALAMSAAQSTEAAVRREAAGVLAYLKNDAALGTLTRLAIEDPSTEVRRVAVGGLGFSNNVDVLPALMRALGDSDWLVREEAALTIGKLKLHGGIQALIEVLSDAYWQVRIAAARSLGKLKAVQALEVLCAALSHEVSNLRKEAAVALGEIGDNRAIPALERAANDPDPDVRKLSRLALSRLAA